MFKTTLATLLLTLGMAADPTISVKGEDFTITFEKGAVFACTTYKMVKATETNLTQWPDGRYAPKHCWSLSGEETSYPDDWAWINAYNEEWEVSAEVGYPVPSSTPGVTDVTYVKSNTILVRR